MSPLKSLGPAGRCLQVLSLMVLGLADLSHRTQTDSLPHPPPPEIGRRALCTSASQACRRKRTCSRAHSRKYAGQQRQEHLWSNLARFGHKAIYTQCTSANMQLQGTFDSDILLRNSHELFSACVIPRPERLFHWSKQRPRLYLKIISRQWKAVGSNTSWLAGLRSAGEHHMLGMG